MFAHLPVRAADLLGSVAIGGVLGWRRLMARSRSSD
jgi:hypothetical protein